VIGGLRQRILPSFSLDPRMTSGIILRCWRLADSATTETGDAAGTLLWCAMSDLFRGVAWRTTSRQKSGAIWPR
jgi:hypothetical protein